jgi:hypothetical protein
VYSVFENSNKLWLDETSQVGRIHSTFLGKTTTRPPQTVNRTFLWVLRPYNRYWNYYGSSVGLLHGSQEAILSSSDSLPAGMLWSVLRALRSAWNQRTLHQCTPPPVSGPLRFPAWTHWRGGRQQRRIKVSFVVEGYREVEVNQ